MTNQWPDFASPPTRPGWQQQPQTPQPQQQPQQQAQQPPHGAAPPYQNQQPAQQYHHQQQQQPYYPSQQHPPPPAPTSGGVPDQAAVAMAQGTPAPATPNPGSTTKSRSGRRSNSKPKARLEDTVLVTQTPDEETEDGRIRNREAVRKIRDTWIYKQVRARQDEFTQYRNGVVFTGTWNVNAKGKDEPLDDWLCGDWKTTGLPDLVAVGFQEIVDLNAVNVAVDNKTQQRSQFWTERLRSTLHAPHNNPQQTEYVLLSARSMVGLLICVFCKAAHQNRVRYVHAAQVGVGVMGMMGNKGGVSIRLQFYDSTLCFVCTHLAAHRENVSGRNADFANVHAKTSFEIGDQAIREVIRSGSLSQFAMGTTAVGIADHDIVFWLGDLNYRIDESIQTERVLQLSEKGMLGELIRHDQLNIERAAGRVFEGFEEGPLRFPPTYKYQPGTDMYEQRPDKKLRAPAWCDRILWSAQEPSHCQQLTYSRSEKPNVSDHKAVYSSMRITIKDVIHEKREAIYSELMHLLDRYENQTLPIVGLDRVRLDFGEIRYERAVTMPIQITNTGSVLAQFRLVPKPDERDICKPWMKISPTFGMLIPGDRPASIDFTVTIDNRTAQLLNSGQEVLDDILILRLEGGRDYYLSVKATFARSCFGMSVDDLVMYSEPIRNVPLDPLARAKLMDTSASALCVPKELWRLVDAIWEKGGCREPHIFSEPGLADEVQSIRESLDTGAPFGQNRVLSYAEVLVSFLSSLATPILPTSLFPTVEIDSQTIQSSARRLLEELPPIHYNVFVYMISFFREVLIHRESNLLSAAQVARICCNCMAPGRELAGDGNSETSASLQKRTGMQLLILHLLETSSI